MPSVQIVKADARHIPLADNSVQCVVTSPPFWGLRKYAGNQELAWNGREDCEHRFSDESIGVNEAVGNWQQAENGPGLATGKPQTRFRGDTKAAGERKRTMIVRATCVRCGAWRGAYGQEPTVSMFVEHTIQILCEIRRVLRADGVVFLNLGDSYYQGSKVNSGELRPGDKQATNVGSIAMRCGPSLAPNCRGLDLSLKPKNLCLIPQRVAIAAQEDGWWVRSVIVWSKPNPMPESVRDRPTDAYEYILMLSKSSHYYWDAEAVAEPLARPDEGSGKTPAVFGGRNKFSSAKEQSRLHSGNPYLGTPNGTRNLRNVWTFSTQSYKKSHFATFPEELPRRCILAATSEKGACRFCGAPWERVVKTEELEATPKEYSTKFDKFSQADGSARMALRRETLRAATGNHDDYFPAHITIGWRPTCRCPGQRGYTVPCLVLDPFAGSGTTGKVSVDLGRNCILCDLAYQDLAMERIKGVQLQMASL